MTAQVSGQLELWSAPWYPGHIKLTTLAKELSDTYNFKVAVKLVDEHLDEAETLRLTTIPFARVLRSGKEHRRTSGALGEEALREILGLPVKNGKARGTSRKSSKQSNTT